MTEFHAISLFDPPVPYHGWNIACYARDIHAVFTAFGHDREKSYVWGLRTVRGMYVFARYENKPQMAPDGIRTAKDTCGMDTLA